MSPYIIPGLVRRYADLSVDDVASKVCNFFDVPTAKVFERTRKREIVKARHVLIWLLRNKMGMTLVKIAESLKIDHTTVLYSVQNVNNLMDVYPDLREDVKELVNIVRNVPVQIKQDEPFRDNKSSY